MSFQTDPSRFEAAKTPHPQALAGGTGGRRIAQAPVTHAPVKPAARCFE